MNLYVLRHAIAVDRGTKGYVSDRDRPLTSRGRRRMYEIARGMKVLKLSFDAIISSPFVRARETAEIVAEVFSMKDKLEFGDHLAVGGDPSLLISDIRTRHRSADGVMVVGHEPYLSNLIAVLVAGERNLSITLKKGGLCKLTVQNLSYARCATLEWLLAPRQLMHLS